MKGDGGVSRLKVKGDGGVSRLDRMACVKRGGFHALVHVLVHASASHLRARAKKAAPVHMLCPLCTDLYPRATTIRSSRSLNRTADLLRGFTSMENVPSSASRL